MKPLSVRKIKQAVKDMQPGSILIIRKADNQIMSYQTRKPVCLELDYDIYMMYYKEKK